MKTVSLVLIAVLPFACGKKDSEREEAYSFTDSEQAQSATSSGLDEAMNVMADAGDESGGSLALTADKTITRSCKVDGANASVAINSSFAFELEKEANLGTVSQTVSRSAEITRVWSREGESVLCDASGTYAQINPATNPDKLSVQVTYSRSHERKSTLTTKAGRSLSATVSGKAEGQRLVNWQAQSTAEDGSVTRSRLVSGSGTRSETRVNRQGESSSLNYEISISSETPLAIDLSFESQSALTAKTRIIKSGTLVLSSSGNGRVESTFDQLKVSFDESSCTPESGSVTNRVFADGATEASYIIKIEANDGVYTATDITDASAPKELEDFDYQLCDIRAFND